LTTPWRCHREKRKGRRIGRGSSPGIAHGDLGELIHVEGPSFELSGISATPYPTPDRPGREGSQCGTNRLQIGWGDPLGEGKKVRLRSGSDRVGRIAALALALTLLAGLLAWTTSASAGRRGDVLDLINDERADRNLRRLRMLDRVSRLAQSHSRRMARRGEVFPSPNLPDAIRRYRWSDWGENAGCGISLRRIHRGFMEDRSSRRNVLNPTFRRIGIGVARSEERPRICDHATFWVTEILFG
jgi:cysteine-rich secretory family protein